MKSTIKTFITLLICMFTLANFGDVLLWTIDDSAYIDNVKNDIYSFISPLPDDDDNWAVGRVKITTGSGEVIYPILGCDTDGDMNTPPDYYSGEDGVWIGGGGDFWRAAWNQSVLPSNIDEATALIAIELGIQHYNANDDTLNFELLAYTDPHTYEQLQNFMYTQGNLNPMTANPWTPIMYHTVPEPTVGLLLLIGIGFLSLRRKPVGV